MMNWLLCMVVSALWVACIFLHHSRNRYRESAKTLAKEVVELRSRPQPLIPSGLTPPRPKAQTPPKRYTGAQLRRMAEQDNNAEWDGLQERPNSEILREQE